MLRDDGFGSTSQTNVVGTGAPGILQPGQNCWKLARAERVAVLVDGAAYFVALDDVLRRAARSVTIIGWDFDASIRLRRGEGSGDAPTLGEILRAAVEDHPELEIRILVWNLSTVHAPGATLPLIFGEPWSKHPRIQIRLDNRHPIYGAQHQKIVCIDESIAFIGGIDLTLERWDTTAHTPDETGRVETDGATYGPVHDMQIVVHGEAALWASRFAYHLWETATGEPVGEIGGDTAGLWPDGLDPEFVDVNVALARTAPRRGMKRGIREIEALNHDALRAAQHTIYIEAQYFADRQIARLLAESLARSEGPEIVVVVPNTAHSISEGWIMGGNRDRVMRVMMRADRHGRLLFVYPVIATDDGDTEIFVHSKLVIVDDRFVRVGSSNFNRRSTGLDKEFDVAIEAKDEATRRAIGALRSRLLGEHLGTDPENVASVFAEKKSLLRAIDTFSGGPRQLRQHTHVSVKGPTRLMTGTRLLDPRGPFRLASLFGGRRKATGGRGTQLFRRISDIAKRIAPTTSGSK